MTPSRMMSVHRMRWIVSVMQVQVALLRPRLLLRAFNPAQARIPAGRPEGGRWTDGNDDNSSHGDGGIHLVENDTTRPGPIDLRIEEMRGGHTLRDHVGKSDTYLLDIVGRDKGSFLFFAYARIAEGSFRSQENAEDFVNRTIDINKDTIDAGIKGKDDFKIEMRFGYSTGKEAFRPSSEAAPYMRDTYHVKVILRPDPRRDRGFSVVTAFPFNRSPSNP